MGAVGRQVQLQGKPRERWGTSPRTWGTWDSLPPLLSKKRVCEETKYPIVGKLIKVKKEADHATLRHMAASLLLPLYWLILL